MPTNAEMMRLLGKIGSDRRTVKTTLLTHLRQSALRHSGEAHALTDALFGSEEGGIVTHRIGEEAAASEVGIEKSNGYALQCGWVEAYDCARTVFSRCWAALPMQVKINAYLSQRRRMALRPFSQVTSASVPSRESREVLHYF